MELKEFKKKWLSCFAKDIDKNTLFLQETISGIYFPGNFCLKEAILLEMQPAMHIMILQNMRERPLYISIRLAPVSRFRCLGRMLLPRSWTTALRFLQRRLISHGLISKPMRVIIADRIFAARRSNYITITTKRLMKGD